MGSVKVTLNGIQRGLPINLDEYINELLSNIVPKNVLKIILGQVEMELQ